MNITVEHLIVGCGAQRDTAEGWLTFIREAARFAEIDTEIRLAAFLSTIGHESAQLTRVVENLNYSWQGLMKTWPSRFRTEETARKYARNPVAIANKVYANRMGNGNEDSGDGFKYRGKGLIQITGKTNHLLCGVSLNLDLLNKPDLLTFPRYAALSAAWFWHNNHLNDIADTGDIKKLTKRVNGGLLGYEDRLAKFEKALSTFA